MRSKDVLEEIAYKRIIAKIEGEILEGYDKGYSYVAVDGTLQLTKSGSRSVVTLWETKLNQQTQQDQKTAYKLWLDVPLDWTDGTSPFNGTFPFG